MLNVLEEKIRAKNIFAEICNNSGSAANGRSHPVELGLSAESAFDKCADLLSALIKSEAHLDDFSWEFNPELLHEVVDLMVNLHSLRYFSGGNSAYAENCDLVIDNLKNLSEIEVL